MTEERSFIKDYSEEKVTKEVNKNQFLLDQYFSICLAINTLAENKKMTARAWRRVERAVNGSLTGQAMQLQSDVEIEMTNLKLKRDGIKVHMIVADNRLLEAAKNELMQAKKIAEKKMEDQKQMMLDLQAKETGEPQFGAEPKGDTNGL